MSHSVLVSLVRSAVNESRERGDTSIDSIVALVAQRAAALTAPMPQRVINATGTILHTNLGRAPLSHDAVSAVLAAAGHMPLELNPASGKRGSRQDLVEPLLNILLGSEAAFVVTNNAAALTLVLRALAYRRGVLVSRGQLVEIGDGFRLPSIIAESGAKLVEVGTTNRTQVGDYAASVIPRSAAFLHVHAANFVQTGFVECPSLRELAEAAHSLDLLLISDNGSGSLVDTAQYGLRHEPMPAEALTQGADIVTFSTDKLLGGTQGGVIAGRQDLVQRIRRHPLARSFRPDKLMLAALRATLQQYVRGQEDRIPLLRMLAASPEELAERAALVAARLQENGLAATAEETVSAVGGGSLPGQTLPSWGVVLRTKRLSRFAQVLRIGSPPIFGRIQKDRLVLDLRTVEPCDDELLTTAVTEYLGKLSRVSRDATHT